MKNIKKFIVLILVFAVCATMLASCNGGQKEKAIAIFGDNYIYEDDADFSDFYNLLVYLNKVDSANKELSTSEHNKILREAVNMTIEMRLLEDEAARRGYTLDMANVEKEAAQDREVIETTYSGGVAAFLTEWNLSEEVFIFVNKHEALLDLAKKNFFTVKNVKDEEALAYYEKNKEDFIKKPHYEIKELFLQVTEDISKLAVYADAVIYIGMLNLGRSWDEVLGTAQKKYNLENGMIFSHYLTGSEIIEKQVMAKIGIFDNPVSEVSEKFKEKYGVYYEEMFPDGFAAYIEKNKIEKDSAEYKRVFEAHMTYCAEVYDVKRNYAVMENWKTGKAYVLPIYHGGFESYVVIYFSDSEDEEGEISFADAKEEIIKVITEERIEKAYGDFISRKMNEIDIQIRYEN